MNRMAWAAVMLLITSSAAWAHFAMPTDAPVDRLVKNATAYIAEHPDDAQGYYVLGRIHYLAWSIKTGMVPVWGRQEAEGSLPEVVPDALAGSGLQRAQWAEAQRRAKEELHVDDENKLSQAKREAYWKRAQEIEQQLQKEDWSPAQLDEKVLDQHARQAVTNFQKAIKLKANEGLYHLGLASLCEQYAERAGKLKLPFDEKVPVKTEEEAARQWQRAAMEQYRAAFELAATADSQLKDQPVSGIGSLVSYEAGRGYLRVAKETADRGADQKLMDRMSRHVAKIEHLPIGAITPLVFSLRPGASLEALIDVNASVAFDLDGTGRAQRWMWVKPDTAILVWDPAGTGEIRSGRQLFGSVTWWLLPGDGYRALDLLDDDRDGQLTGAELRGLAVWFDRNGNGVSEPGEVAAVERLGIAGIGVRATGREGQTLMNETGLRLAGGTALPTWDWVARHDERGGPMEH